MYDSKKYRLSRPRTTARRAFEFDGETLVETGKLLRVKTFAELDGNKSILIADVWLPPIEVIRIAQAAEDLAERQRNQQ